jgi:hypothetical protein
MLLVLLKIPINYSATIFLMQHTGKYGVSLFLHSSLVYIFSADL